MSDAHEEKKLDGAIITRITIKLGIFPLIPYKLNVNPI